MYGRLIRPGQESTRPGRARLRGLVKVQIQGLLTAVVLNVKKLLQVVCLRGAGVCRIGLLVVRHIVAFAKLCSFGPFHSDIYFEKNCDIGSG